VSGFARQDGGVIEDQDRCYRAVLSRDRRFDGVFYTGVLTTGIYCRPSCPAVTPHRRNVRFFATAAAAQSAGLRACKRCRPDTTPGSPEWDLRADVAGRAMRLINDGVVERSGVPGLAARLGYSERQLNRVLVATLGAGPLALARARRAQTARILVETTAMPLADVAFAAGFASVRQFNDTFRATYALAPSALRARRPPVSSGDLTLRLAVREPFDGPALLDFLALRAVPGVEEVVGSTYRRTLDLPHGPGVVALTPLPSSVQCVLRLHDLADLPVAVERCRRLLDLDADPLAVVDALGSDPVVGPLVLKRPGLRVPGHVSGVELAVRAVLGQQVSVAGARTLAARLVASYGSPLPVADGSLTHLFPSASALAVVAPDALPMPRARAAALVGLATALASGDLSLDRGVDRASVVASLLTLPGIGPWTASYVALRALGDPDAFLPTDLGVRHAVAALAGPDASPAALAEAWRPWRSYALMHLWTSLGDNA
jgi:AraC family transcriptional regulator of adaptative response / DNA-3-methyladenine glycosylase II